MNRAIVTIDSDGRRLYSFERSFGLRLNEEPRRVVFFYFLFFLLVLSIGKDEVVY